MKIKMIIAVVFIESIEIFKVVSIRVGICKCKLDFVPLIFENILESDLKLAILSLIHI